MKKWNDLSDDVRRTIEGIDKDLEAAHQGISIKGIWTEMSIRYLTDDDKAYLRDEVIRLLKEGKMSLLEDD